MCSQILECVPSGEKTKETQCTVTSASGNNIECEGAYPVPFEIDKKKFVNNIYVLKNLSEDFILGINFFQDTRLAYDPGAQEIYWTNRLEDCQA
jgi:hypothetical protein